MTTEHNNHPAEVNEMVETLRRPYLDGEDTSKADSARFVLMNNDRRDAADLLERIEAERAKLQAIVDQLPKTADGKRYDELERTGCNNQRTAYLSCIGGVYEVCQWGYEFDDDALIGLYQNNGRVYAVGISDCYSTRQAAVDAVQAGR